MQTPRANSTPAMGLVHTACRVQWWLVLSAAGVQTRPANTTSLACQKPCGRRTCDIASELFSCEELWTSHSCDCTGCCVNESPPPLTPPPPSPFYPPTRPPPPSPTSPFSFANAVNDLVDGLEKRGTGFEHRLGEHMSAGAIALTALASALAAIVAILSVLCIKQKLQRRFDSELVRLREEMEEAKRRQHQARESARARRPTLLDDLRNSRIARDTMHQQHAFPLTPVFAEPSAQEV